MNLETFLHGCSYIDNEIRNLVAEKEYFALQAMEEKLLEVEVGKLRDELSKVLSKNRNDEMYLFTAVNICPITLPTSIITEEDARKYIIAHRPNLTLDFICGDLNYKIPVLFDYFVKTSDGQRVLENINITNSQLIVNPEIKNKILLNLNPLANYMQTEFGQAVYNCVKSREKLQECKKDKEKQ